MSSRPSYALDHDMVLARLSIQRASSLLRVEIERIERVAGQADHDYHVGELAPWQAHRVCDYIDAHLEERIYVEDLSRVVQRSTAHFCRAFKRTLGETPHHYIARRRLFHAGRMMLTSDTSLSQIAARCGFSDQAHFSNRFRLATGQSPAAWRRARREAADRAMGDENLQTEIGSLSSVAIPEI